MGSDAPIGIHLERLGTLNLTDPLLRKTTHARNFWPLILAPAFGGSDA